MTEMVFDWKKAAQIICAERPQEAEAGLRGDWGFTGSVIFRDFSIVNDRDEYMYLESDWARPQIKIDGRYHDCFVMKSDTEWDGNTKWPDEARSILITCEMLR